MINPEKFESKFEKLPKISPEVEEERRKVEISPENRELFEDIIEFPAVQNGLKRYEIFVDYYFGNKLEEESTQKKLEKWEMEPPTKEEIKQRADEVFGYFKDPTYEDILGLEKPAKENEKFNLKSALKEILVKNIANEFKKEELDQLRKAKEGKTEKNFDETLKNILIDKGVERDKGIRVGKLYVTLEGKRKEICYFHIPRFAKGWEEAIKSIIETYKLLADHYLLRDEKFKNVEKLEGFSWIYGDEKKAKSFDTIFGWEKYTDEQLKQILGEEGYRTAQFTGIKLSPKLFDNYLFYGDMPKIGGRWIEKEKFIEKMENIEYPTKEENK